LCNHSNQIVPAVDVSTPLKVNELVYSYTGRVIHFKVFIALIEQRFPGKFCADIPFKNNTGIIGKRTAIIYRPAIDMYQQKE